MTLERTEFTSIWVKEAGDITNDYDLLPPEETGMGDATVTGPTITIIRGRDADGQFVDLANTDAPPGSGDTFQVNYYGHYDTIVPLEKFLNQGKEFYIQMLSFASPPVDIRSLAKKIEHYKVGKPSGTRGAGRNQDGTGGLRTNNVSLTGFEKVILNLSTSLSRITNALAQNVLSVEVLTRDIDRKTGYRGPDKVIFIGMDDDGAGGLGLVAVSIDGGASFASVATDPSPFANTDTGINGLAAFIISETQFRLVATRESGTGAKAEFSYTDITFGGEATVASWTEVTIAATANTEYITAMLWPQASRLYFAAAGDIYKSTDLGSSDPGAAKYTGSNALNAFFQDNDKNVWCVGASNTILVELANARNSFVARTGPSGGGTFTAIAVAKDGTVFAGNGQVIYRSSNGARTAGGWTSLKDFGSGYTVKKIVCVKGSSQILYCVASSTSDGKLWVSTNGGLTWTEKTAITNAGYTAAAAFADENKLVIVGNVSTTPVIGLLS